MTYHERELLVSRTPQKRTFNNSNHRQYASRVSTTPLIRVQYQANERHFLPSTTSHQIDSSFQSIRWTMNEQTEPIRFRSEIVVHSNPDTDLHIKRLRVNFHVHDDIPVHTDVDYYHHPSTQQPETIRSQSLNMPRTSFVDEQNERHSKRKVRPGLTQSQVLLHQWIDDICANERLMANDDIVFFIKNGEFFARI